MIYAMVVAGLLSRPALHAQDRHEFSVYGGGGLSSLKYEAPANERKDGFGGQFGLGYKFFFSPNWGLGTGAEMALYKTVFNPDNIGTRYMATDTDGDAFEFRSELNGYEEKQKALLLQIPLMLQYQTGNRHKFYAAAGGKIGFPLSGKYGSSSASIRNSGFYAEENYEYTTQEFMGFGAFPVKDYDGSLKFKAAFFASAEAGVKWKLNGGLSLYTGAYLDYGLNNIYKESGAARQFVAYNSESPRDFTVNSVLNSQYAQNGVPQAFTGKITPVAAGIKISLAFGIGSTAKKKAAHIPPVADNMATGE
ncbi:hypothetical protein FACS189451_00460 [Bacteroidia bacterium]|nr:hypothetical protein FACS189451_00460 [Bacteroidia bacterium]